MESELEKITIETTTELYKRAVREKEAAYYRGYKNGWNDCEKKIRNYMKRHCERWKDEE